MTFLELNKYKLKGFVIRCSLIGFVVSEAFFLLLIFDYDSIFDLILSTIICLLIGLILTIIVFPIAYLEWYRKFKVRSKKYNLEPIIELESKGFTLEEINVESKFSFTETVLSGKINDFKIFVDESGQDSRIVEISIVSEPTRPLSKIEIDELSEKLKNFNSELSYGRIVKLIKVKELKKYDIRKLASELETITETLKDNSIQPIGK